MSVGSRIALLLCGFGLAMQVLAAPKPAPMMELPLPWIPKAIHRYSGTVEHAAHGSARVVQQFDLELHVLGASREGYRIGVLGQGPRTGAITSLDARLQPLLFEAVLAVPMVARLDGDGSFLGFEEAGPAGAQIAEALRTRAAAIGTGGDPARLQLVERLAAAFNQPAYVDAAVYHELNGLWSFTGAAMQNGEQRTYSEVRPVPMPGGGLPVQGTVQLSTAGAPSGAVRIVDRRAPDPEALAQMIDATIAQAPPGERDTLARRLREQFQVTEEIVMTVRIVDGVPTTYQYLRQAGASGEFGEQRLVLRLVDASTPQ